LYQGALNSQEKVTTMNVIKKRERVGNTHNYNHNSSILPGSETPPNPIRFFFDPTPERRGRLPPPPPNKKKKSRWVKIPGKR
jgi:hypothetical protein